MSFHYYSCRYLPPLPSTHVCLSRGLQWRLDKNSPKINHSISQPSENICLYFHQISTIDEMIVWVLRCAIHPNHLIQSTAIENQGTHLLKNALWGLLLFSYNEDGPVRQNFCKRFGASGWADLL